MVIAVIGLGHMQSVTQGPSGFTRIVRDLGRKFCDVEREELSCDAGSKGDGGAEQ